MENNNLFTEISPEEAANVSGGGLLEAAAYLTVMKAFFPNLTDRPEVLSTALLFLMGALSVPRINSTSLFNNDVNATQGVATQLPNVQLF